MLITMQRLRGLSVVPAQTAGDQVSAVIVNSGSGDAMNALNDFVGAAKMWTQPGNAITQIKNIALGHSTANVAEMAGLATVPLALVLIIPQIFSKRRRR